MKHLLRCILCLSLCLGLVGCGTPAADKTVQDSETQNSLPEETSTPSPADATISKDNASNPQTEEETLPEIPFSEDFYDYDSMADMFAEYGIRFGAPIRQSTLEDYTMHSLIMRHFNSVTATNELKAYSMLDQKASQQSPDGMPAINFTNADALVELAMDCGVQMRGHVLVWDAHMCNWFFREGYQNNTPYVDRETMLTRLNYYITQVITHFEENYPGVIYCWDVVNEAVGDNNSEYDPSDVRHIRTKRNGENNPFYEVIGDDYVEISFLYAKNTVEALQAEKPEGDIKLFYNDYNTFSTVKRDAIYKLIESINSYETDSSGTYRKLCDGVGMQGYIGGYGTQSGCLNVNDILKITDAIKKYASLGVEVQLTEMAVRNYEDSPEINEKHAAYYKRLIRALITLNSGEEKPLTGITIWGLTDMGSVDKSAYAYKMNGPYCGLFTPGYYVKDAFYEVYVMLKEQAAK